MLTYLIIQLDDTSVSFCGVTPPKHEVRLMPLDVLRSGIVWAMKENLNVQFVYPYYKLPESYREVIETIDHTKIGPHECGEVLDVTVVADLAAISNSRNCYIWHCSLDELEAEQEKVTEALLKALRLNVILTEVVGWKESQFNRYTVILESLSDHVAELFRQGRNVQFNLLTDRLILNAMNNCGAGDTSVTLAPDGKFYVCPAYYYSSQQSIGDLKYGLDIKNQQLFRLAFAPICRHCDAYQCRRCVWQNEQLTLDCNTPSHEQCMAAHLERNASRRLLLRLNEQGARLEGCSDIREIDYLDPFNIVNKWK